MFTFVPPEECSGPGGRSTIEKPLEYPIGIRSYPFGYGSDEIGKRQLEGAPQFPGKLALEACGRAKMGRHDGCSNHVMKWNHKLEGSQAQRRPSVDHKITVGEG